MNRKNYTTKTTNKNEYAEVVWSGENWTIDIRTSTGDTAADWQQTAHTKKEAVKIARRMIADWQSS